MINDARLLNIFPENFILDLISSFLNNGDVLLNLPTAMFRFRENNPFIVLFSQIRFV